MTTGNKRLAYVGVLVVIGLVSVLRLVRALGDGDSDAAALWIALLVVAAVVVVTLAVVSGRASACAANAARHRPGMPVVPGFTTAAMPEIASGLGVSRKGWMPMGGSPVAVVAAPGEYEIWGRKDSAPRWTVRRGPGAVSAGRALYGNRHAPAVLLRDEASGAEFVPAYRPLRATGGLVGEDVDRAVAELTGVVRQPGV
ncbi:hypothetical protein [Isoptericola cucumis]|uniref:Integral membrane protein n=1 Tax=Isoptericola cucumis TaxID=1776856 RepID=A0ABQ2BBB9_9MICO|nr:hypothetical protein [Isoptericola cucumis]GGI10272.1 hypothetical protein GCM10007368_30420 [Isoptericola cucumis]